jgi:hypothetical protein
MDLVNIAEEILDVIVISNTIILVFLAFIDFIKRG